MRDLMSELSEQIKRDFHGAQTDLETFASGSAMLHVRLPERLLVLAYSPASGFGVDEVQEDDGFNSGYRFVSKDYRGAVEELYRLLSSSFPEPQS